MNSSKENAAHGAPEKLSRREPVFSLVTARKMVPLLHRIVTDVQTIHQNRGQLVPEQDELDRRRHTLKWPERSRRYAIRDELVHGERHLREAMSELKELGVALIDPINGLVGFPTMVNNRKAYFSWQNGEESVTFWHFPDETIRRAIPENWSEETPEPAPKRRVRKSRHPE